MAAVLTSFKRLWEKLRNGQGKDRSPNVRISTAQRLSNTLYPFEHYLVSLQSILIWENPKVSSVAIVVTNLLFLWVTVVFKLQLYGIFFTCILCMYLYRTFVFEVWPEIRLSPAEGEDTEEWTTVNPQVFSVPEISRYMDNFATTLKNWNEWLWSFHSTNPGLVEFRLLEGLEEEEIIDRKDSTGGRTPNLPYSKTMLINAPIPRIEFCVSGCILFTILAIIGQKVSGIFIVYMIFLTITIGPGVMLHVIPRAKLENLLSLLVPNNYESEPGSELKNFIPEDDSENLAALEIPLNSDDSEPQLTFGVYKKSETEFQDIDGSLSLKADLILSQCLSPYVWIMFSSLTAASEERPIAKIYSLITPSLTLGLQNLPDPTYENPNNEFLPSVISMLHSDPNQMQFVPTHFNSNSHDVSSENASQGFTLVDPKSKKTIYDAVSGDLIYKLGSSIATSAIKNIISSTLSGAATSTASTGSPSKNVTGVPNLSESEASDDSSGFEIIDEDYEFSESSA
ncbi:Reticulophagy regulator 3 [Nymphon striatum]|nr:Reticulophagy regulator 3 [Nymphon striatum]